MSVYFTHLENFPVEFNESKEDIFLSVKSGYLRKLLKLCFKCKNLFFCIFIFLLG